MDVILFTIGIAAMALIALTTLPGVIMATGTCPRCRRVFRFPDDDLAESHDCPYCGPIEEDDDDEDSDVLLDADWDRVDGDQ